MATTPRAKRRPVSGAPQDGYCPQETHYALKFEGTAQEGLAVTMSEPTFGELLDLNVLRFTRVKSSQEAKERVHAQVTAFVAHLVSWNLLHPRSKLPVETTVDGYLSLSKTVTGPIYDAWLNAIDASTQVPDPLDDGSTSGPRFPEASIPMETR